MKKQRVCKQCGVSFPDRRNDDKFCCMACYALWQTGRPRPDKNRKVTVPCWTCGTLIARMPSALAAHNFCGRECYRTWRLSGVFSKENNPTWRGGNADYRGPNWQQQRKKALERDGYACVTCGRQDQLTVNHKMPFRLFASYIDANQLTNLETLCRGCHSKADNRFWLAYPLFFTTPRVPDCRLMKRCKKCGEMFEAAPRALFCIGCCTFQCAQCGTTFTSRHRRHVRFCSRACNIAFRKAHAIYPHACRTCGKPIGSRRYYCRQCYLRILSSKVPKGRRLDQQQTNPNVAGKNQHSHQLDLL